MKLFLVASKHCYKHIPSLETELRARGHTLVFPNCYDNPEEEDRRRSLGKEAHALWKRDMILHSTQVIDEVDGVLVLNFEKNGIPNYIGGATFLETYDAFRLGKKIFLYNPIPEGILHDEICGFCPTILQGDLNTIQ